MPMSECNKSKRQHQPIAVTLRQKALYSVEEATAYKAILFSLFAYNPLTAFLWFFVFWGIVFRIVEMAL